MKTISQKITGVSVRKGSAPEIVLTEVVQRMHESVERPEVLEGRTYKLRSPALDSALYITINDVVLNAGTEHEARHPYEVFINGRDLGPYQWIVALTRLMSAVFRKGGDVTFIVDELRSVFDPAGGYYKNQQFVPSLVADIGIVIEQHLMTIGLLNKVKAEVVTKRQATEKELASASQCSKCHEKSVVVLDGCATCLSCGDGKCG